MKRHLAFPLLLASTVILTTGCPDDLGVANKPQPTPTPTPTSPTHATGGLALTHAQMPANTWTVGAPMAHARGGLSAGVVEGRIFALGGDSEASIETYQPALDAWRLDPLPDRNFNPDLRQYRARHFGAAVATHGRIVHIGGTYDSLLDLVDVYNPVTNLWVDANLPQLNGYGFPLMQMAAVNLDGEIIVTGGLSYADAKKYATTPVDWVASLTMNTRTGWMEVNEKAALPAPRAGHAAAVLDGQLYVVGGFGTNPADAHPEALGSMIRQALNDWTDKSPAGATLPPMNQPRHSFGAAVLDGKWIVAGGLDSNGKCLDSVEEYDPATNTWTPKAPMPTARAHVALAALNGRVFALGGYDDQRRALRSVDVFRP